MHISYTKNRNKQIEIFVPFSVTPHPVTTTFLLVKSKFAILPVGKQTAFTESKYQTDKYHETNINTFSKNQFLTNKSIKKLQTCI